MGKTQISIRLDDAILKRIVALQIEVLTSTRTGKSRFAAQPTRAGIISLLLEEGLANLEAVPTVAVVEASPVEAEPVATSQGSESSDPVPD